MKTLLHTFASFLVAAIASLQIHTVLDSKETEPRSATAIEAASRPAAVAPAEKSLSASVAPRVETEQGESSSLASSLSGFPLQSSPLLYAFFGVTVLALTIVGRRVGIKDSEG